jgi:hypothetical protein
MYEKFAISAAYLEAVCVNIRLAKEILPVLQMVASKASQSCVTTQYNFR